MKLLLTSAGIKNTSFHKALLELLGIPVSEASALFIPTAIYPFPRSAGMASDLRKSPKTPVRTGLEVLGSVGAHRAV
jgi:dipeptidase E